MKSVQLACMFLMLVFMASSARADQLESYLGAWRQISSNAGDCPRCVVTVRRLGINLEAISNNGWRATLRPTLKRLRGELPSVEGDGFWETGLSGQPKKISIEVMLARDEAKLHMALVTGYPAARRVVEATFEK